jgi:CBS domain-containing protein
LKIRDIMNADNLVTVRPDHDLGLAAQMLVWRGVRHLPVLRGQEVVGVLSERDILQHRRDRSSSTELVERAMRSPAITVSPDESVADALTIMLGRKVGCLPVVERGGLVGMLTRTDLLRSELESYLEQSAPAVSPALSSVMRRAPAAVAPETDLLDAASLMSIRCVRHLPVLDPERRVIGMLSDRDLRVAIGDPRLLRTDPSARTRARATRVADVMSRTVIALDQNEPLTNAVDHLLQEGIGALPIVDGGRHLVGIVSYVDVLQALR